MFEGSRGTGLEEVPTAVAVRKRRSAPQLVWLIPIVAALVGGWIVVKGILDKGPTITISFKTAEGLEAGKTKVKFRSLDVGEVKSLKFDRDRQGVLATVELVKEAERYLVDDTKFWVVRPRIAGGQVSGLGTLFSGSYIGVDLGKSGDTRRDFVGLEVAPIVTADVPGRHFVLRADTLGSIETGSPVYFRQETVGTVDSHEINKDGQGVTFKIFVNAPYDQYVNAETRFWNASGIDVTLDTTGVKVDTQSIVSILIGGIAFETLASSAQHPPAEENHEFLLADNRAEAMKRVDTVSIPFQLRFGQSIRGLSVGAPVDFRGIVVGEVKSVNIELNQAQNDFQFPVGVVIYPGRVLAMLKAGSGEYRTDEEGRRARWDKMVAKGLRGQLRTGNLLTGQLYIAMDMFPDAPEARIDWTATPPMIPSVHGGFEEFQATLTSIARKIEKMPIGEIGADVRRALQSLNRTLVSAEEAVKRLDKDVSPTAKATLEDARRTLTAAERTLAADAPLQQDLRMTLRELTRTSQSLRQLTELLERQPESLIRGKKETKQ
ncbi:MAG TPA: MlaD family protein [Nitrospiraceae bacterium]|nr:MlaD family protein [Nitrospiraceae bacterium]